MEEPAHMSSNANSCIAGKDFVAEYVPKLTVCENALFNHRLTKALWPQDYACPITLQLHSPETSVVPDIIIGHTKQGSTFESVITVLSVLCDEVYELKHIAETELYPPLAIFGEVPTNVNSHSGNEENSNSVKCISGDHNSLSPEERRGVIIMGRALSFFKELCSFSHRCNILCRNFIQQLSSIYHSKSEIHTRTFKGVTMTCVFDAIGDMLQVLITLDALVRSNAEIADESERSAREFEDILLEIDRKVIPGRMFQNCVDQDFALTDTGDPKDTITQPRENKTFLTTFWSCIKLSLTDITEEVKVAGRESEALMTYECEERLVGLTGLYALYTRLLPPSVAPDQVFLKRLWSTQKIIPIVCLYGQVHWFLDDFLTHHMPFVLNHVKSLSPKDPSNFRKETLSEMDSRLHENVAKYIDEVSAWVVATEAHVASPRQEFEFGPTEISRVFASAQNNRVLTYSAIALANRIQRLLINILNLHTSEQVPMSKGAVLVPLAKCVELLKVIQSTLDRKIFGIASITTVRLSSLVGNIRKELRSWFKRLEGKNDKGSDMLSDVKEGILIMDRVLKGSSSLPLTRRIILKIIMNILTSTVSVNGLNICKTDEIVAMAQRLSRLDAFCDWQRKVKAYCDCSILYWHNVQLLPHMLMTLYTDHIHAHRLPYILDAFCDARFMLQSASHISGNVLVKGLREYIVSSLNGVVVVPLCREVENTLRLHHYSSHLEHMKDSALPKVFLNGRGKQRDLRTMGRFLSQAPMHIIDVSVCIKEEVEKYLEREFYNMTVLALHDWKTYGQMRNIARENLGLEIGDSRLPQGTLDMGLDVLQIMRNIHVFVSLYNYNLNQQYFIEKKADRGAKHLNTINISSIANSIRTHGCGIMNTCVNFTYQFLSKKFYVFSQFLFDEHIKSYLSRENRWYRKHKKDADVDHMYPFERALKFNKDIRRLGQTKSGLSFLGQFRILITEIGNALGYVRMVRSAGMHWVAEVVQFIPDIDNIPKFCDQLSLISAESRKACENVDSLIADLSGKFAEGTDYLKVLVDVFQQVMLYTEGSDHLNNFFVIIPSLVINFIETNMQSKEQMARSHKGREAYFTDDGFATGVAYVLAILKQGRDFDALHWFKSVEEKYTKEIIDVKDAISKKNLGLENAKKSFKKGSSYFGFGSSKSSKKLFTKEEIRKMSDEIAEMKLSGRRLQNTLKEYRMLMFALSGARSFLKVDDEIIYDTNENPISATEINVDATIPTEHT